MCPKIFTQYCNTPTLTHIYASLMLKAIASPTIALSRKQIVASTFIFTYALSTISCSFNNKYSLT